MKIIAYILFALQILSMVGNAMNGGIGYLFMVMFQGGIPGFIGYMLPTIVGIILLAIRSKRQRKKNTVTSDSLAGDSTAWCCAKCGTLNSGKVHTCQGCGINRHWSGDKT